MTLKTATIGLGRMGAEPSSRLEGKIPQSWLPVSHAEVIQLTKGMKLVALCDHDNERLHRFSEYYKVNAIYTDYKKLIDEVKPDIISIATRTDVRFDIIDYALKNGVKGFYVEKPISRSIKDCKEILKRISQNDAKIVYGATRRGMDVYKKAKEICWSGELGEVQQINIEFGLSPLLWTHPHSADLIVYFANSTDLTHIQGYCNMEPDSVKSSSLIDYDPLIENAYLKFGNNISATINQTNGFNVRIACSKGILTILGDGNSIEINRVKDIPYYFHTIDEIFVDSNKNGTQYLMEDLQRAVTQNIPVLHIKPEEIICGQQILFGLVESTLQKGRMLTKNDLNDDLIITGRSGQFYA